MTATKFFERTKERGRVTAREICRATGATYRQVEHWTRQGLLECEGGGNPGAYRSYAPVETDVARLLHRLSRAGLTPSSELARHAAVARTGKRGTVSFGPLTVEVGS